MKILRSIRWAVAMGLIGMLAGCDDERFDREPPPGMGTVIVDNYTGDDIEVFLDGMEAEETDAGDHRYYDLEPGLHRVVLTGDDTDRTWAEDVDVLENRRTVLEVRADPFDTDEYDVDITID